MAVQVTRGEGERTPDDPQPTPLGYTHLSDSVLVQAVAPQVREIRDIVRTMENRRRVQERLMADGGTRTNDLLRARYVEYLRRAAPTLRHAADLGDILIGPSRDALAPDVLRRIEETAEPQPTEHDRQVAADVNQAA